MAAILEKTKLALLGGQPVRTKPFAHCNTIGAEEKRAVAEVMETGVLSEFVGVWGDYFACSSFPSRSRRPNWMLGGGPAFVCFQITWAL